MVNRDGCRANSSCSFLLTREFFLLQEVHNLSQIRILPLLTSKIISDGTQIGSVFRNVRISGASPASLVLTQPLAIHSAQLPWLERKAVGFWKVCQLYHFVILDGIKL